MRHLHCCLHHGLLELVVASSQENPPGLSHEKIVFKPDRAFGGLFQLSMIQLITSSAQRITNPPTKERSPVVVAAVVVVVVNECALRWCMSTHQKSPSYNCTNELSYLSKTNADHPQRCGTVENVSNVSTNTNSGETAIRAMGPDPPLVKCYPLARSSLNQVFRESFPPLWCS